MRSLEASKSVDWQKFGRLTNILTEPHFSSKKTFKKTFHFSAESFGLSDPSTHISADISYFRGQGFSRRRLMCYWHLRESHFRAPLYQVLRKKRHYKPILEGTNENLK